MNKRQAIEGTLSKLFHEIMFYILFPGRGSVLNKQVGKRERIGRIPSTVFEGFRHVLTRAWRPTGELTEDRLSESDL